jgi:hypothetical protein
MCKQHFRVYGKNAGLKFMIGYCLTLLERRDNPIDYPFSGLPSTWATVRAISHNPNSGGLVMGEGVTAIRGV